MEIPVVDLSLASTQATETASALVKAFSEIGFVYLRNHGIPAKQVSDIVDITQKFFNLPQDTKMKYLRGEDNFGYVQMEMESLNPERPHGDLKEAFNFTPTTNQRWPETEVPRMREELEAFWDSCAGLSLQVLELTARGLGLDPEAFTKYHHLVRGNTEHVNTTTVRALHYPPVATVKAGQVRCGEHSDYGSITLLFPDMIGGLEVKARDVGYIPATPIPDTVVVNIGDLMQRWTSDKLVSTKHRVLIPEEEVKQQLGRRSIAFFVQPDNEALIECVDGSHKYEPITSLQYLQQRFSVTY